MKDIQKTMIESYIAAYNACDVAGMMQHLDDQVIFQNISNGEIDLELEGIEAFKEQAESAKSLFSSRKQTIQSWDIEGDTITIGIDYEGVLAMDLPNGLEAGDVLALQGSSTFEFADNQIVKIVDKS